MPKSNSTCIVKVSDLGSMLNLVKLWLQNLPQRVQQLSLLEKLGLALCNVKHMLLS